MKRKKVIMAGIMLFLLASTTGCGKGKETASDNTMIPAVEKVENNTDDNMDDGMIDNTTDTTESNENIEINNRNDSELADVTIIGGKIRSIAQDSFVLSRTLIDENGYITMPEAGSPDEQLVTVQCPDATVFEHWTIQGGGAGIEKKEASFADITEGGGLEAEGHFEREVFVADKVIIEVYQ